ncbi:MAG: hypothetical protein OXH03_08305 [Bacteroidetes bacterium]|nr:hypothetical protein [Bacteroidota bacterium]MDE2672603.1 hypothetical protein [Bacteroidota bacterium]
MNLSVQFEGEVRQGVTSILCTPGPSASEIRSADLVPAHHQLRLGLPQLSFFSLNRIHIPEELDG